MLEGAAVHSFRSARFSCGGGGRDGESQEVRVDRDEAGLLAATGGDVLLLLVAVLVMVAVLSFFVVVVLFVVFSFNFRILVHVLS